MRTLVSLAFVGMLGSAAFAQGAEKWVTSWAASAQGPYPIGNPSVQPNQSFHFPAAATGARDQSFRLIVRPDIWSRQVRLRLSNAFGTKPVTFDGVFVGLQLGAAAVMPGTNQPVRFGGQDSVTVKPGEWVWSDPVTLPFVREPRRAFRPQARRQLPRRRRERADDLAREGPADVLRHGAGRRREGRGRRARRRSRSRPPPGSSSTRVDAMAAADAQAIVAFGDSITDGTASTMNGDDRWPDVLARRLRAAYGNRVAVVNAGIGGNQVAGPPEYSPEKPFPGGPSAAARLDRDVISLSGVTTFVWLEGINDFSRNGNAAVEAVEAGMREGVARLRAKIPGIRVLGATVVTALGSTSAAHGFPEQDEKRKRLNAFIRSSGVFDAVLDFDGATLDPQTGGLKPEFVPDSTTGGPGDKLHPNRVGYLAIATSIDLKTLLGKELQPATR